MEDLPEFATCPGRAHAHLLRQHLAAHGVSAAVIEPFTTLLAERWPEYLELLVSDDGRVAGFMTVGRGNQFATRLAGLLAACKIAPPLAVRMLAFYATSSQARCLLRLELPANGVGSPEISVVLRRPMALECALQRLGATPEFCNQVRECAALLQRRSIHGIALTATALEPQLRTAVRFAQAMNARRREPVRLRLAQVASRYAPCSAAVSLWAEHHDSWVHEHAALSVWLAANHAQPAEVRIEYPEVTVRAAASWLQSGAAEVSKRFAQLCALTGRATLSCLEVSLRQAEQPKLYAAAQSIWKSCE